MSSHGTPALRRRTNSHGNPSAPAAPSLFPAPVATGAGARHRADGQFFYAANHHDLLPPKLPQPPPARQNVRFFPPPPRRTVGFHAAALRPELARRPDPRPASCPRRGLLAATPPNAPASPTSPASRRWPSHSAARLPPRPRRQPRRVRPSTARRPLQGRPAPAKPPVASIITPSANPAATSANKPSPPPSASRRHLRIDSAPQRLYESAPTPRMTPRTLRAGGPPPDPLRHRRSPLGRMLAPPPTQESAHRIRPRRRRTPRRSPPAFQPAQLIPPRQHRMARRSPRLRLSQTTNTRCRHFPLDVRATAFQQRVWRACSRSRAADAQLLRVRPQLGKPPPPAPSPPLRRQPVALAIPATAPSQPTAASPATLGPRTQTEPSPPKPAYNHSHLEPRT